MKEKPGSSATAEFRQEEERVAAHSGVFKKELGLADLALTAILSTLIGGLVLLTTVGLGVGKWVHKAGGVLMLVTFLAILTNAAGLGIYLVVKRWRRTPIFG